MHILVIDIGGTNVKIWKTGQNDKQRFPSGKSLTPEMLVLEVRALTAGWEFDRVSIGYPGTIRNGAPVAEPYNLGPGWVRFDFQEAFHCPVRMMNDACMQALGSYEGGRMLYLGLGTSIGTTLIDNDQIIALALGHLRFRPHRTYEDCLSRAGLRRLGKARWSEAVHNAALGLKAAFLADYVVLGGGNAKKLETVPDGCRRGGNHHAYFGGLRMWEDARFSEGTMPLSSATAPPPRTLAGPEPTLSPPKVHPQPYGMVD